jgi:hypothetical protein
MILKVLLWGKRAAYIRANKLNILQLNYDAITLQMLIHEITEDLLTRNPLF